MLELLAYNLNEYGTGYCFMNEDIRNNLDQSWFLARVEQAFGAREVPRRGCNGLTVQLGATILKLDSLTNYIFVEALRYLV